MKAPYPILLLLVLLALYSCQDKKSNNPSGSNFSEIEELEEVMELTDDDEIENHLDDEESIQLLQKKEQVIDFYKNRDYEPIWNNRPLRENLFGNIEEIESEGLFFEDYHGSKIRNLMTRIASNTEEENTTLELLLTDAFLRLTEDLATGKLNPKEIYDIWGTPLNEIDSKALLTKAIAEGKLQEAIDSVKPKNSVYLGLKQALKSFKRSGIEEDSISKIPGGGLIRPGDKDERMPLIVKRLSDLDYLKVYSDSTLNYTPKIQQAVKEFQQKHGLLTDALIGNSTVEELNLSRRERYHQVLVNLERWRWYPRNLGDHYVIANIPAYELSVVKNGDTIRKHKTMVGTEARKTPVFTDEIAYIVYNPTWTIPPTIKKNDVIPGIKRDPNYLKKKNLQVLDGRNNTIDPSTIDWSSSKARNYVFRQQAGPSNPLGMVKIIYPNQYMIYLHDTPSKDLFNKNARAQSSGCVRVQDALDLASYFLSDQEKYDNEKINEILRSGKTTEIPVTKGVKVHHFYWTAYNKNGNLNYIHDIYKLDRPLWEKFKPAG